MSTSAQDTFPADLGWELHPFPQRPIQSLQACPACPLVTALSWSTSPEEMSGQSDQRALAVPGSPFRSELVAPAAGTEPQGPGCCPGAAVSVGCCSCPVGCWPSWHRGREEERHRVGGTEPAPGTGPQAPLRTWPEFPAQVPSPSSHPKFPSLCGAWIWGRLGFGADLLCPDTHSMEAGTNPGLTLGQH